MHRKIKYKKSDFYLKYLGVNAYYVDSPKSFNGRFGEYMKNEFLIDALPYKMDLVELIEGGGTNYELLVQLPNSYFDKWVNYPSLPANFNGLDHAQVDYFDILCIGELEKKSELLHPYDTNFRDSFVDRYKIEPKINLDVFLHNNSKRYRPYEFYLSYWRGYVFLELNCECKFIEKYLNEDSGKGKVKEKYHEINKRWVEKYSSAFNKIASYRSAMAKYRILKNTMSCSMGEIAQYLIDSLSSNKIELLEDMETLLSLDEIWRKKLKDTGINSYKIGLDHLKKDIYNLFEWLCYLGVSEEELFSKFDDINRQSQGFTPLKNVLDFEKFAMEKVFKSVLPIYSESIINCLSINLDNLCSYCENVEGFESWIRSFYDLHQSINNDKDISFLQPRLINELLVITIRTEIIIKGILKLRYSIEEGELKDVFNRFSIILDDGNFKSILFVVFQRYKIADLRDALQNDDLFKKVDDAIFPSTRPKIHRECGKSMMRFVVSRNYFAHHSYKDSEINLRENALPRDILVSCINTVLYIYSATQLTSQPS